MDPSAAWALQQARDCSGEQAMAGSLTRTSPVPCAPFSMLRTSGRRSPACAQPSFYFQVGSLREAGTSVPSTAEISEAFGPVAARQRAASAIALHRPFLSEIAAAGGFWCSAYHLSLFAILEALAGFYIDYDRSHFVHTLRTCSFLRQAVSAY